MTGGDETARVFDGRYVLGERLTASEAREVWEAHDDLVTRRVALKIFFGAATTDPAWRSRFRHTAERLKAVSHPGIASVYEYDESDAEAWLATAFVAGTTLADRLAATDPPDPATVLDLIGQAALAVQAAHDVGVAHGNLGPGSLMVRPDGSAALIGFAVGDESTQADDLRAIGRLAADSLSTSADSPDVEQFVDWVSDPHRPSPPRDAGEIGRTALALATSLRTGRESSVVPAATPQPAAEPAAPYDEAERKRVRNALIVLGTIVVVGGAALLRFVGEGGGDVTVPSVIGLPLTQAQNKLVSDGLRAEPTSASGGPADVNGTVTAELPPAGTQLKAGSTVVLTVSSAGTP